MLVLGLTLFWGVGVGEVTPLFGSYLFFCFLVWLEVVVLWLKDNNKNSVELEASLTPAEAEVGAVAKADQ